MLGHKFQRFFSHLSPVQLLVMGYAGVILSGALMLWLPFASRAPGSADPLTALFTATTSTCVTGLVVADTFSNWTLFGQFVILLLIQIGGLGFMTMATLLSLAVRRNISMRERLVMMNSFNLSGIDGVVRITKNVLKVTFICEFAGAVLLSTRLVPRFGLISGVYKSLFTSVSAFCNAGIDLFGEMSPYTSLTPFRDDLVINYTVMALIITGGIGFFVWNDIYINRRFRKLSLYTKIVLTVTAFLIAAGAAGFYLFESGKTGLLAGLPPHERFTASLFQSVTSRTAGFNTVDIAAMSDPARAMMCILMFIGGSSGSTAGGIKTVTFIVLVYVIISALRGKREVVIRERRVSDYILFKAIAVTGAALAALFFGTFVMVLADPQLGFGNIIFECVSALGTVGLSTGITPDTGIISRFILIILMFFGRVGILSISISLLMKPNSEKIRIIHPEGKFFIG